MTKRMNIKWMAVSFAALPAGAVIGGSLVHTAIADDAGEVKLVASEKLPNVPGKSITAVMVGYVMQAGS
jgi:hypothetical protein